MATAAQSGSVAGSQGRSTTEGFRDLRIVASSIAAITLFAMLLTAAYSYASGSTFYVQVLWSTAIWCAAAGIGFLFGIPKVLQADRSAEPEKRTDASTDGKPESAIRLIYQQRVNTNLEEISDWLTKIIVGVTLVELKSLWPAVRSLAIRVGADIPQSSRESFGLAIVTCFSALGFLFGYLVTRLYIQGALARAERAISDPGELERQTGLVQSTSLLLEQVTRTPRETAQNTGEPAASTVEALRRIGDEYMSIGLADWSARVKEKDRLAALLFTEAARRGVARDWLVRQAYEPYLLAAAAWAQAAPEPQDAARLIDAGRGAERKHVRYWIVQALGKLADNRLMTIEERARAGTLIDSYLATADPPLARLIEAVKKRL